MRLFVAIAIPSKVRDSLFLLLKDLRTIAPKAKWVRVENLHVTLKFLGNTDPQKLEQIESALKTVRSSQAVTLDFRGLGFFPNEKRPRVFWGGMEASANLRPLAESIDRTLHQFGFPLEERPFTPHLTLARFDPPGLPPALADTVKRYASCNFGEAIACEFHLIESKLKSTGAEYTTIQSFPFVAESLRLMSGTSERIAIVVLAGYLLGSIPFGLILAKIFGRKDVREHGSGNIGATNVSRVAGPLAGILTLLLDAAKGAAAVWFAARFTEQAAGAMMLAGIAALLGHCFPVWLKFRGGKGVATALGVYMALCPLAMTVGLIVFLLVVVFWRYVSLGSLSAAAAMPLLIYFLWAPGHAPPLVITLGTLFSAALLFYKHDANLQRLVDGTEPKFSPGKSESDNA